MLTWTKVAGAVAYEFELLMESPSASGQPMACFATKRIYVNGYNADLSEYAAQSYLYWRVRGIDQSGNPVGVYSEAQPFNIDMKQHIAVAAYGDSITHGGGSISYSPADWEYSYQYYLDFPTINLARSGDTSESMVERFEQDVVPFHPRYLLILAGSNSLRGSATARSVIDDLVVLRAKCLAHQIQPVFLTIPPIHPENIERAFQQETAPDWREKIWLVNQFIRTQQHIDIARALEDGNGMLPEQFAIDGLHPDSAGKKRMAAAINAQWKDVICGK